MRKPKISIILVNWNGKDVTLECLKSLQELTYGSFEVILVDNGSEDGSVEAISAQHPEVLIIRCKKNLGFTGANNIGIRRALDTGADAVLLLNNDTVVAPNFLEPMVDALYSDPMVGAVNPKIYYYDDKSRIWSAGGMIDFKTGITWQRRLNELDEGQPDTQVEIDYGVGCALMVKREAIKKAGFLDEAFFIYYEEVEWCQRIKSHGFHILYAPASEVWHKVSTTMTDASDRALYYFCRNRLLFLKRTRAGLPKQGLLIVTHFLRMAAAFYFKKKRQQSRVVIRAVADYCTGRFGQAPI